MIKNISDTIKEFQKIILESEVFVISVFRGEKNFSKKRNEKAHKRIDRTKTIKTEMI